MKNKATDRFTMIPDQVLFDKHLSARDIRVYGGLRAHRNERKKSAVYPAKATLALKLDCSEDTVERAIKRLVRQGHLSYVKGCTGRSNKYQFQDSYPIHTRTDAGMGLADLQAAIRTEAESVPAKMRYQPEPIKHNHQSETKLTLFYGQDRAYIEPDGVVTLRSASGERVSWSGYHAEDFVFGSLYGEEALKAARKQYDYLSEPNKGGSGTLALLPTSEKDSDPSRPTTPLFNNPNG